MKRFNTLYESYIRDNVKLTRVILKVDPKIREGKDFRNFDGYEGFIIEEGTACKVLVENCDFPIMDVPFTLLKIIDIPDQNKLNKVKQIALKYLKNKKELTSSIVAKISTSSSFDFFEQFLRDEGLKEDDLKKIYKNALVGEGIAWDAVKKIHNNIKAGARGIGKVISTGYNIVNAPNIIASALNSRLQNQSPDRVADKWFGQPEDRMSRSQFNQKVFKRLQQYATQQGCILDPLSSDTFEFKTPQKSLVIRGGVGSNFKIIEPINFKKLPNPPNLLIYKYNEIENLQELIDFIISKEKSSNSKYIP